MAVVEGRLQIRDWQDRDGNKRRSAEVVADNVYFGDSRRDGDSQDGGYVPPPPAIPPLPPATRPPANQSFGSAPRSATSLS